jgi:7-cyano-7-deazaguanine synthase
MARSGRRQKKAVVLLSGGLDSAVTLYAAKKEGFDCTCLIFDYGQRHKKEISAAKKIACIAGAGYRIVKLDFPWKGSSLLDKRLPIPGRAGGIPSTYVPGRNIVFLSIALSCAEAIGAAAIYIGAHAQDYSGYPDCRPEFFSAFRKMSERGTKAGVTGKKIRIVTPLINKGKARIIALGNRLGVRFELTWSCYRGQERPCGNCDSCRYRAKGFREAGLIDPGLRKR